MCEPVGVGDLELAIGHRFNDPRLLAAASTIDSRAFGALEHLGDAIADLAVAIACWRSGLGPQDAAGLVSNDHLDAQFAQLLDGLVNAISGDVIEALVGAVFLDAGFDDAAAVAVRLCWPDADWSPLGAESSESKDVLTWLGAAALDAVVASHAVRTLGVDRTSQRELNEIRRRTVNNAAIRVAVERHLASEGLRNHHPGNWFKQQVAARLLASGWNSADAFAAAVLELPSHA